MKRHIFTIKNIVIYTNYNGFFEKLLRMKINKYFDSKNEKVTLHRDVGRNIVDDTTTIELIEN